MPRGADRAKRIHRRRFMVGTSRDGGEETAMGEVVDGAVVGGQRRRRRGRRWRGVRGGEEVLNRAGSPRCRSAFDEIHSWLQYPQNGRYSRAR